MAGTLILWKSLQTTFALKPKIFVRTTKVYSVFQFSVKTENKQDGLFRKLCRELNVGHKVLYKYVS